MGKIILIALIFLGLTLTLSTGFAASNTSLSKNTTKLEGSNGVTTNTTSYAAGSKKNININVLIYSGRYTSYSCVNGIKTSLKTANTKKLVPGYTFTYATSTVINSATLTGYDVLAMPGGTAGYDYLHSSSISGTAIKNFVKSGKGYVGICAGAYSGTRHVYGYYYGWGLTPHINANHPDHEGILTIQFTSNGTKVLNTTGVVKIAHYNGPAMYVKSPGVVFAKYADNIIHSKGMAAIAGDYYGKGRVVLSGPHPELDPQLPKVVANMMVWAAHKTKPDPTNIASLAQISSAAASVKSYYEKNKALPKTLTINKNKISMSQFSYLLSKAVANINSKITATITIKAVKNSAKPSGTNKKGNIQKSNYITLAKNVVTYINKYGKMPNYLNTPLGKLTPTKMIYMYSKVMVFYKTNKRLPNFVSM